MLQNQYFEIMEDIIRNDGPDKPTGNTPQHHVPKPATGSTRPDRPTTKPAPSKTAAPKTTPKTTAARTPTVRKPSATGVTPSKTAAGPAGPAAEKAPVVSAPVTEKKSKKLAQDFKKLKVQKKEIASLEKNRDRLMKDLISAIENKKKSKKIRSLARDFNRIEKRVKNRNASHIQAKKKLTKKMK